MKLSLAKANLEAFFQSTRPPGPLAVVVGDRVGYAHYHLRAIGVPPADALCGLLGTVMATKDEHASVSWDGRPGTAVVSTRALAKPGANLRCCAG